MEFLETFEERKVDYLMSLKLDEFNKVINEVKGNDYCKSERKDWYNQFKLFLISCKKTKCSTKRFYNYSKKNNEFNIKEGRLYSDGIQVAPQAIRNFLCTHTTDLDMKNASPTIIRYLCKINNISCANLDKYCNERDSILTTATPKSMFLKSIFKQTKIKCDEPFFRAFDDEMKKTQKEFLKLFSKDKYPHYYTKDYNVAGSLLSQLSFKVENEILQLMVSYLKSNDYSVFCLIFDGLLLNGNHYDNANLLIDLENLIESKYIGLNMKLAFKPIETNIIVPENFKSDDIIIKKTKDFIFGLLKEVEFVKEIQKRSKDFLWSKESLFCWNGKKWEQRKYILVQFITQMAYDIEKELYEILTINYFDEDSKLEIIKSIEELKTKANSNTFINKIIELSESYLYNDKVEFDTNRNLIAFDNGVFDTDKWCFRKAEYSDFITMSCNYDFVETPDKTRTHELNEILKQIQPDDSIRKLWLTTLAKGLSGIPIEKFVIFNGGGRNGKGLITEFTDRTLGDYCYLGAPCNLLFNEEKDGPNPFLKKMDKKRLVIFREPSSDKKLKSNNIKNMSGGGKLPARDLWQTSINSDMIQSWLLIMECNKKPDFDEDPEVSIAERVIDIPFESTYYTDKEDVDEKNRKYLANANYKETWWQDKYRIEFLHILLNHLKGLKEAEYKFILPPVIKKRIDEYLQKSFPILVLFKASFVKLDDTEKYTDHILKVKDIIDVLKNSDLYNTYTKAEKRKYSYTFMLDFIKDNKFFKSHYHDNKKIDGIKHSSIILGWKRLETNTDDTIDSCVLDD